MKHYQREALVRRLKYAAADLLEAAQYFESGEHYDSMGRLSCAQGESWVQSAANILEDVTSATAKQEEYFEKWGYKSPC